jgi:hypothetical protein
MIRCDEFAERAPLAPPLFSQSLSSLKPLREGHSGDAILFVFYRDPIRGQVQTFDYADFYVTNRSYVFGLI